MVMVSTQHVNFLTILMNNHMVTGGHPESTSSMVICSLEYAQKHVLMTCGDSDQYYDYSEDMTGMHVTMLEYSLLPMC